VPDVLITAGATRNPIDVMRSISANSSGATGLWLAGALAGLGEITVLGSTEALLRAALERGGAAPAAGRVEQGFGSTRDLMDKMQAWVLAHPEGVVIHAAAVGDYEAAPRTEGPQKIPSGQAELHLRLLATPKIVDHVRQWAPGVRLVSFKAASPETTPEELLATAEAQRARTGSAAVFGNVLTRLGELAVIALPGGARRFTDRQAALRALVALVQSDFAEG
jgi:phosphopantothenoylcysteine synthetase/decarboxylase